MDTILLLYEYDILTKEITLLYNYGNKLKTLEGDTVFLSSRLISCSLITGDSKDIIICLTINTEYELDLFSFNIKNNFTFNSFESIETISDLSDISSISKNSKDVLFCFLEVQYFKCFVYNSEKKEKSVIIEYFDGCYVYQNTRGIKYITERREYIIYCHKINSKDIMFAKLDENFNKKELEGNLEYINYSIEECYNIFSSSFIYDKINNKYSMAISCQFNTKLFKISNIEDLSTFDSQLTNEESENYSILDSASFRELFIYSN